MDTATIEIFTEGDRAAVIQALNSTIPNSSVTEPTTVREPILVTAIVVSAAVLELVNGLIELRRNLKGLKIRGLLGTEESLDDADPAKIEDVVREGMETP